MENTRDNKARFLLISYANNRNSIKHIHGAGVVFSAIDIINNPDEFFSELKPLSAISDEDAIEQVLFAKKIGENISVRIYENDDRLGLIELGKWRSIECLENLPYQEIDFLRSKGYAVNWIDLTVDQQIEYGWIKLTNQ